MRRSIACVTALLLFLLAPAVPGQMTSTTFTRGEATFTQGDKMATWMLADNGGHLNYEPAKPSDYSLGLRYRPKSAAPENLALLDLSLMEEGNSFLFSLNMQQGPGGNTRALETPLGELS